MSKKTAKKKTAKKGRPSNYTEKAADEICERLSTGETLKSICRSPGMPHESTVRKWARDDHKGFYTRYARSRDIGMDAMADELFDIADDGTNDWMERHGEGNDGYSLNGEHVSRSRLRVDTRKWYLSKLAPKRYGEKLEVTEKTELQDASDEQLHEAIRKRIASMKARGIDVEAMINDAGES